MYETTDLPTSWTLPAQRMGLERIQVDRVRDGGDGLQVSPRGAATGHDEPVGDGVSDCESEEDPWAMVPNFGPDAAAAPRLLSRSLPFQSVRMQFNPPAWNALTPQAKAQTCSRRRHRRR